MKQGQPGDLWEYTSESDSWLHLPYNGPHVPTGREYAVGFRIKDDLYFMTGNYANGDLNDFWRYNLQLKEWIEEPPCPFDPRCEAIALTTNIAGKTKAYVGLGKNREKPKLYADFWEFDPTATPKWTQIIDYPEECCFACGFSIEDKLFVGGGEDLSGVEKSSFYMYNGKRWTALQALPSTVSRAIAFSAYKKGYVMTGWGDRNEVYEFSNGNWQTLPPFPGLGRSTAIGFTLGKGSYLAMGFRNGPPNEYFNDVWEYVPD